MVKVFSHIAPHHPPPHPPPQYHSDVYNRYTSRVKSLVKNENKAKEKKYKDFIEWLIKVMIKQNGKVFVRITVVRMKKLGKNLWW